MVVRATGRDEPEPPGDIRNQGNRVVAERSVVDLEAAQPGVSEFPQQPKLARSLGKVGEYGQAAGSGRPAARALALEQSLAGEAAVGRPVWESRVVT